MKNQNLTHEQIEQTEQYKAIDNICNIIQYCLYTKYRNNETLFFPILQTIKDLRNLKKIMNENKIFIEEVKRGYCLYDLFEEANELASELRTNFYYRFKDIEEKSLNAMTTELRSIEKNVKHIKKLIDNSFVTEEFQECFRRYAGFYAYTKKTLKDFFFNRENKEFFKKNIFFKLALNLWALSLAKSFSGNGLDKEYLSTITRTLLLNTDEDFHKKIDYVLDHLVDYAKANLPTADVEMLKSFYQTFTQEHRKILSKEVQNDTAN